MIVEAEDFAERFEAADFVFRVARADLSAEARRVQAFQYAMPPGPHHGVLSIDADETAPLRVRPGAAEKRDPRNNFRQPINRRLPHLGAFLSGGLPGG